MSKRYADTDKFTKEFIQALPAGYKLLWDYICLNCNHAGIWYAGGQEWEIAQMRIGRDVKVDKETALLLFNGELNESEPPRVIQLNGGKKWFLRDFIAFQYETLSTSNRVHLSVLQILAKEGINTETLLPADYVKPTHAEKTAETPQQAAECAAPPIALKPKTKGIRNEYSAEFERFWAAYPKKVGKVATYREWKKVLPDVEHVLKALGWQCTSPRWTKADDSGRAGAFIPDPERYVKYCRYDDLPDAYGVTIAPKPEKEVSPKVAKRKQLWRDYWITLNNDEQKKYGAMTVAQQTEFYKAGIAKQTEIEKNKAN